MWTRATHFVACAFLAASLAFVSGCNGSSSGTSNAVDTPVPVGGNNVEGLIDPIQDALLQVGGGLGAVPVVGDTAAALISALVALLDVPDGLLTGLQEFLFTQDPAALLEAGELSGDALLSFAAGLSETLIQLTEEGEALPIVNSLTPLLLDLEQQVQDGVTGETGGGDLTAITDLLVNIANLLQGLTTKIPAGVENAPLVGNLVGVLGTVTGDLGTLLDSVGRLDGDATSATVVGLLEGVVGSLTGALPGVGDQLTGALSQVTTLLERGLGLLLDPLFQALRGVLAPITGPDSPFGGLLDVLLSADLSGLGGLGGLGDLLGGGGTASDGTSIPLLGDLLGGLPLLGDLLGGLLNANVEGANAQGGLSTLEATLSGGNGLPLLGDLLQGVVSQPGSSEPASLPLIGDLLSALLAPDGGVPIIGTLLDNVETDSEGLPLLGQLPILGDLLNGLLGGLLGQAGDSGDGGFTDVLGGLPVLGPIVGGLLDGLLGGLLNPN